MSVLLVSHLHGDPRHLNGDVVAPQVEQALRHPLDDRHGTREDRPAPRQRPTAEEVEHDHDAGHTKDDLEQREDNGENSFHEHSFLTMRSQLTTTNNPVGVKRNVRNIHQIIK